MTIQKPLGKKMGARGKTKKIMVGQRRKLSVSQENAIPKPTKKRGSNKEKKAIKKDPGQIS